MSSDDVVVSVPSEPMNFVNKSRSSTTIEFDWLPPLHPNGVLLKYQVLYCCRSITSQSLVMIKVQTDILLSFYSDTCPDTSFPFVTLLCSVTNIYQKWI